MANKPAQTATAGNWIPSGDDQSRLKNQLRGAVQQLAAAAALLQSLTNIMSQMAPGGEGGTIETYFGLQAGDGQVVHGLVSTASGALQGGDVQGLLQRLG